VRQEWNDHRIRRQNRHEVHGKPDMLYNFPEIDGTVYSVYQIQLLYQCALLPLGNMCVLWLLMVYMVLGWSIHISYWSLN